MSTNGTIKRMTDKGFGFIATPDGTEYFFHQSACTSTPFDSLRQGESVTFTVGQGPKDFPPVGHVAQRGLRPDQLPEPAPMVLRIADDAGYLSPDVVAPILQPRLRHMRNLMKHLQSQGRRAAQSLLVLLLLFASAAPVSAQQTVKWMTAGSLQSWFSSLGCEIEEGRGSGADQQDGLEILPIVPG